MNINFINHNPKTPLQRVARGGVVVLVVVAIAVAGYRFWGGYDWLDAIWLVVVTISTVGYAETSTLAPGLQVLTIFVILVGMSAAAYTFGGLIQLLLEGEIDRLIGLRRMTSEIAGMRDHVIICGFGRMGRNLAEDLQSHGQAVVIIDADTDALREADEMGFACLTGDATEESVLTSAGIERARTLVAALSGDAENVFLTLTARNLNTNIQIVARADQSSTEMKLKQAGANSVVLPTVVGSRQMARVITRPTTADLIELVSQREFADLELDEVAIAMGSKLVGLTVGETHAHRDHDLLVVAVKNTDADFVFNPSASHRFRVGEVVILMGHTGDIQSFRQEFNS